MTRRWAFVLWPLKLTRGIYTYILDSCSLESDLKMSKSHVNEVSFDENVSHLSHMFEQNEHFLLEIKQTSAQLMRSRKTKELMWPSRTTNFPWKTCVLTPQTDSSFKTSRNGDEVLKRSRSKFTCKYTCCDREPSRLRCNKKIKMLKKKQVKYKTYYYKALYLVQYTIFVCNKNFVAQHGGHTPANRLKKTRLDL